VVIPVSDQDPCHRVLTSNTLGFEKRSEVPFGNGYRWVEVAPADAVTTIADRPPAPRQADGQR